MYFKVGLQLMRYWQVFFLHANVFIPIHNYLKVAV